MELCCALLQNLRPAVVRHAEDSLFGRRRDHYNTARAGKMHA